MTVFTGRKGEVGIFIVHSIKSHMICFQRWGSTTKHTRLKHFRTLIGLLIGVPNITILTGGRRTS